jgi:hypothetical protein
MDSDFVSKCHQRLGERFYDVCQAARLREREPFRCHKKYFHAASAWPHRTESFRRRQENPSRFVPGMRYCWYTFEPCHPKNWDSIF